MSAPVPPLLVPGWIIDSVLAEHPHTVVVAARGAEPVSPPALPQFATIVITRRGHERAAERVLEALVARQSVTLADVVDSTIVMWDGHGVAACVLRDGVRYEPDPLGEPEASAHDPALLTEDRPAEINAEPTARRRTYVVAAFAAAVAVLAAWVLNTGGPQAIDAATSIDPNGVVTWDPVTATVSVDIAGHVRTFRVGEPGDEALFGDWEGDGERTPALYRPTTGELWFFTEWATDDELVEPALAARAIVHGRAVVERNDGVDVVVVHPADEVRPRSG